MDATNEMKPYCGHCQEVLEWDELNHHFLVLHPEWCQGTDAWYKRLRADELEAAEYAAEFDHEFLTGCGIEED